MLPVGREQAPPMRAEWAHRGTRTCHCAWLVWTKIPGVFLCDCTLLKCLGRGSGGGGFPPAESARVSKGWENLAGGVNYSSIM